MTLIKTKLGVSKIHGIGLFAVEKIPKGTETWRFNKLVDLVLSAEEIDSLSAPARSQVLNYAFKAKELDKYILCCDDGRFMNHSKNPNTGPDPLYLARLAEIENSKTTYTWEQLIEPYRDLALTDIEAGEELLCDYSLIEESESFKKRWGR